MSKEFRIYRANGAKTGVASSWQLSYKPENKYDKFIVFLQIAPQAKEDDKDGNAKFLWKEGGITVKIGETDLGDLISTLEGRKSETKIFHESPDGGSKIVELKSHDKGYYLNVSAKKKDDSSPIRLNQSVSFSEASILNVLLKSAVQKIYEW